jgi:tellurium resistance protein TerZ
MSEKISLKKGSKINLTKAAPGLRTVNFGLAWDPIEHKVGGGGFIGKLFGAKPEVRKEGVDLDASVSVFDAQGNELATVYFGQKTAFGGAIRHSGDNLTGEGEGPDETISVDLASLPGTAHKAVFTIASFRGQNFNKIEVAHCFIDNAANGERLAEFDMGGKNSHTGIIVGQLVRNASGEFEFEAIGEYRNGRTYRDMI